MKPQEQRILFNLQMRKGVRLADVKLDSSILLETNISTVRLPLKVYDGSLTKVSVVLACLNLNFSSVNSRLVILLIDLCVIFSSYPKYLHRHYIWA